MSIIVKKNDEKILCITLIVFPKRKTFSYMEEKINVIMAS